MSITDWDPSAPLLVPDLLNDLDSLAPLLLHELRRGSFLNAYLLAAGMQQITDDFLHPDPLMLGKAAKYLGPTPVGPFATAAAPTISAAILRLRDMSPSGRRITRWQTAFSGFLQRLALLVVEPTRATDTDDVLKRGERLVDEALTLSPHLRHQVLRLPSCFRSFDQQPGDLERLIQRFAERFPNRERAIVVVGVRTSGSYLAPLGAAYLRHAGYCDVQILTIRPGRALLRPERELLLRMARRGGLALLTDDPPSSGSSFASAARQLEALGIPPTSIVMLLQLFRSQTSAPVMLAPYTSIVLPWDDWAIHQRLTPVAVQSALASFVQPETIVDVHSMPLPPMTWDRSHARALFEVELVDEHGLHRKTSVLAKGIGLGYFGEHSLAIAERISQFTPRIYGACSGLLYRAWIPDQQRITSLRVDASTQLARSMASYVVARHRALGTQEDTSRRLFGQSPVWEVASNLMSRAYGRGWLLARIPLVDPVVKRLLQVAHPSIVDGRAEISRWFADDDGVRKIDFDERDFSNLDLACYDPVYDLACLAASCDDADISQRLRQAYEELSGARVVRERWAIYQLIYLWYLRRSQQHAPALNRRSARVVQQYFGETYFADTQSSAQGPLCAIDIDGVLEGEPLGFPSLSPLGALALRALTRHGYQPVLVSGRSVGEIRERCVAYHLSGGIAEYGAVLYHHDTGQVRPLLSVDEGHDLAQLRHTLCQIDGVQIDQDFQYAIRCYHLSPSGKRRPLTADTIATVLGGSDLRDRVRPIHGEQQTDFMVSGINKGLALRELAAGRQQGVAFAVGDSISDLPMLNLAKLAFAPANADAEVRRAGVRVLPRPYQSGLALAVTHLLGHEPGSCAVCRSPQLSRESELFLAILGAQERGTWGIVRNALRLGGKVLRS